MTSDECQTGDSDCCIEQIDCGGEGGRSGCGATEIASFAAASFHTKDMTLQ